MRADRDRAESGKAVGIAKRGRPLRKCAGVRTGIPSSGSESRLVMGRQLRVASTCESAVASSSNVKFWLPNLCKSPLHLPNACLPQSSMMWRLYGGKLPRNVSGLDEGSDGVLIDYGVEDKSNLFLCGYKVGAII